LIRLIYQRLQNRVIQPQFAEFPVDGANNCGKRLR
jgi:hypothetical protein